MSYLEKQHPELNVITWPGASLKLLTKQAEWQQWVGLFGHMNPTSQCHCQDIGKKWREDVIGTDTQRETGSKCMQQHWTDLSFLCKITRLHPHKCCWCCVLIILLMPVCVYLHLSITLSWLHHSSLLLGWHFLQKNGAYHLLKKWKKHDHVTDWVFYGPWGKCGQNLWHDWGILTFH